MANSTVWQSKWKPIVEPRCKSKLAKIVSIEIQDGRYGGHLENLFCDSSPDPKGQLTRNSVTLYIKNIWNRSDRKSKKATMPAILKIYFVCHLMSSEL